MKILNDILQVIKADLPIRDILVSVHWTAVVSRHCGLASTLSEPPPHHDTNVRDVGHLKQKSANELVSYVLSGRLLEASIGLASINSLIEIDETKCKPQNAFDILVEKGKHKTVGIIGHFPFIQQLEKKAAQLWVFEKRPQAGDLPESEMENLLPQCDVIGISATTLINHSLEKILDLCRPDAYKVMLGASTPMIPLLFDYGLDVLSGCKVTHPDVVLTHISQGATFKQIKGVKLLSMIRSN